MYGLDTTDVSQWAENITKPAFSIVQSYINRTKCDIEPLQKSDSVVSVPNTLDKTFVCEACSKVLIGTHQWQIHMKSSKHRKVLDKVKRAKVANEKSESTN